MASKHERNVNIYIYTNKSTWNISECDADTEANSLLPSRRKLEENKVLWSEETNPLETNPLET